MAIMLICCENKTEISGKRCRMCNLHIETHLVAAHEGIKNVPRSQFVLPSVLVGFLSLTAARTEKNNGCLDFFLRDFLVLLPQINACSHFCVLWPLLRLEYLLC